MARVSIEGQLKLLRTLPALYAMKTINRSHYFKGRDAHCGVCNYPVMQAIERNLLFANNYCIWSFIIHYVYIYLFSNMVSLNKNCI